MCTIWQTHGALGLSSSVHNGLSFSLPFAFFLCRNADLATQLLHMTQQAQQALEARGWKIPVGSGELVLRDQFDRLVKAVTLFKDASTAAGSIDPLHAGLPLAGFCVLMQVWPVTRCARYVGHTDTVVDGDPRLGTIRGDGGRC